MASFFDEIEKANLEKYIDDIHDTFARDVYYFKEAKNIVLKTSQTFNPIYGQNNPTFTNIKKVSQSGVFKARIKYDTDKSESLLASPEIDSPLKIRHPDGLVRIKVNQEGKEILGKTKRLEFDGRRFSVESDVRPHGLFSPKYFTYFLIPTDKN